MGEIITNEVTMSKYIPIEKAKHYAVIRRYIDGDEVILEYFNTIEDAERYIANATANVPMIGYRYYIGQYRLK